MRYALYAIAAFEVTGLLFAVSQIGKPRKTTTPASAVATIVIAGTIAVVLILAGMQAR